MWHRPEAPLAFRPSIHVAADVVVTGGVVDVVGVVLVTVTVVEETVMYCFGASVDLTVGLTQH